MVVRGPRDLLYEWLFKRKTTKSCSKLLPLDFAFRVAGAVGTGERAVRFERFSSTQKLHGSLPTQRIPS